MPAQVIRLLLAALASSSTLYLIISISNFSDSFGDIAWDDVVDAVPLECSAPRTASIGHACIPNTVHYVLLKKDTKSEPTFSFRQWLSLYSSVAILKADIILLHTDYEDHEILVAATGGSKWTRKVLTEFPRVKINHIQAPIIANDKVITSTEHKSDFVRMDVLHKFGGIYMDWDVLALQDVTPLRKSGFAAVVGREAFGGINNGVIMAQKKSMLIAMMRCEGPKAFDGSWTAHSVELLTQLAERMVRQIGEVLILDQKAFASVSFGRKGAEELFESHHSPDNLATRRRNETVHFTPSWEIDLSSTYLLHTFHRREKEVKGFSGVNLSCVLNRTSNYALAAYPIVKHALELGLLTKEDVEY